MFACILLGLWWWRRICGNTACRCSTQCWERWHTPWWAVAVAFWTGLAPGLIAGYWAARDAPDPGRAGAATVLRAIFIVLVAPWRGRAAAGLLSNGGLDPVRTA
jgi:hypothetical protein